MAEVPAVPAGSHLDPFGADLAWRGHAAAWPGTAPEPVPLADVLQAWEQSVAAKGSAGGPDRFQVYVHFPFCASRCRFCMFPSAVRRDPDEVADHVRDLVERIGRYAERLGRLDVDFAYFGGGTPSLVSTPDFEVLLRAFGAAFRVRRHHTVECNPSTTDLPKLDVLARHGVNRVSMGIQSLDPEVLRQVGRSNPPLARIRELVAHARSAGIWVNLDLVVGLPGETAASFADGLQRVAGLGPDEITLYQFQRVAGADPGPGAGALSLAAVLDTARGLANRLDGYRIAGDDGPPGASLDLLRTDSRPEYWTDRYFCFESPRTGMLGLGPWSYSHVYGHAWLRETPRADRPSPDCLHAGTRLTPEDEVRTEATRLAAEGRWIRPDDLDRRPGPGTRDDLRAALQAGVRTGAVETDGDAFRLRPGIPAAEARPVLHALMPLRWRQRLDREAEAAGSGAAPAPAPLPGGSDVPPAPGGVPSPDAWQEWLALLDPGGAGLAAGRAVVEEMSPGRARLRATGSAAALEVRVEWFGGQPHFGRSRRFALSYRCDDASGPLDRASLGLLEHLVQRTRALDP